MYTTFTILGLTGHVYGLFAALAACVLLAGMRLSRRLPAGAVSLFGVLGIVLGIAGARLLYCLCNLSLFTETYENPALMLNFFDGGLSWPGMVAGLLVAAAVTAKVHRISFANVLDVLCIPMGLSMALLRMGEPFTDLGIGKAVQEGFATEKLGWLFQQSRMGVAVEYRLNVWAYEAFAGVVLFAVMLLLARRLLKHPGDAALCFFTLFGASQVMLESMRDDGHMLLIFLRVGQLAAALMPLICFGFLASRIRNACKAAGWIIMALCAALLVVLEFSLDGRLTIGEPSLLRDYCLMALACIGLAAVPVSVLLKPKHREE